MRRFKSVLGFISFLTKDDDLVKLAIETIKTHNTKMSDNIDIASSKIVKYEGRYKLRDMAKDKYYNELLTEIKEYRNAIVNSDLCGYLLVSTSNGLNTYIIVQ